MSHTAPHVVLHDPTDAQTVARAEATELSARHHRLSAARGAGYMDGDDLSAHQAAMEGDA